ncbi:MAG: DUF938 domain-containing protein [Pseudomonadota bacterium]
MASAKVIEHFESMLHSPAAARNEAAIAAALASRLPSNGRVLELACGGLQHAQRFCNEHVALSWQPSDVDLRVLEHGPAYLEALRSEQRTTPRLLDPIRLDVREHPWPVTQVQAIYTANLLHISPMECITAVFQGAGQFLSEDGRLLIYGPFRIAGCFTSAGDARFDASLRARDPSWGIRNLEDLLGAASQERLTLIERLPMPANNWLLTFDRSAS